MMRYHLLGLQRVFAPYRRFLKARIRSWKYRLPDCHRPVFFMKLPSEALGTLLIAIIILNDFHRVAAEVPGTDGARLLENNCQTDSAAFFNQWPTCLSNSSFNLGTVSLECIPDLVVWVPWEILSTGLLSSNTENYDARWTMERLPVWMSYAN